jgi:predicted nuclease of predicted toxin-antitoxin system
MKFLADENFEPQFVERLRREGHEVIFLDEYESGIDDDEILKLAVDNGAVVITNDKDFGELIFRHGFESRGVVFLRLYDLPLFERIEITVKAIRMHEADLPGAFTVITEQAVRIRNSL